MDTSGRQDTNAGMDADTSGRQVNGSDPHGHMLIGYRVNG